MPLSVDERIKMHTIVPAEQWTVLVVTVVVMIPVLTIVLSLVVPVTCTC